MNQKVFTEEERKEIIRYGRERVRVMGISTLVTLLLGWMFGIFIQSVVFLAAFSLIRRYAGGYHADSSGRCYAISLTSVILAFGVMKKVKILITPCLIVQAVSLLIILWLAPVENANKKLDVYEKQKYGEKSRRNAVLLFIISIFFYEASISKVVYPVCISYVFVALSLIAGQIKNHVNKDEESN